MQVFYEKQPIIIIKDTYLFDFFLIIDISTIVEDTSSSTFKHIHRGCYLLLRCCFDRQLFLA